MYDENETRPTRQLPTGGFLSDQQYSATSHRQRHEFLNRWLYQEFKLLRTVYVMDMYRLLSATPYTVGGASAWEETRESGVAIDRHGR